MTIDNDDLINSIMASLGRIETIHLNEIPNIDLYMDQVTSFMNDRLKKTTRHPETDKIMTKTMINNYAKNNLLPPPEKKKYSRDHMILLIVIYYLKNILSINDIQTLIEPLKRRFNAPEGKQDLSSLYETLYQLQEECLDPVKEDITKRYERAMETFCDPDITEDEREKMHLFSFIALLSYDVYVKKLLIEKILDNMTDAEEKEKSTKEKQSKDKN